mmetsp:Transcript_21082/g.23947  ORF Transcript_21082/g.23947 Transcript_21082/m.23947 type:complete len:885 (+) Transcript_21082:92-2746(+)
MANIEERMSLDNKMPYSIAQNKWNSISCILPSVPAMIYTYIVNHDTGESTFPYVSEYCEQIFGLCPSEIIDDAESYVNLIHPDDVNKFTASVVESMNEMTQWDHTMRMKNLKHDRFVLIHGKSSPMRQEVTNDDGSITKFTVWHGVLTEVTKYDARDQTTDHDCTSSSSCPSFELDRDGKVKNWNENLTEMTGINKEDAEGESLLTFVPESHVDQALNLQSITKSALLEESMKKEDNEGNTSDVFESYDKQHFFERSHELTITSKRGFEVYLQIKCELKRDCDRDDATNVMCLCKDMTQVKKVESEKIAALRSLEADKNLSEWLSHEVRSPLSVALEAAKSLNESSESSNKTRCDNEVCIAYLNEHKYLTDVIIQSISYIVDLLRNMMDLNKTVAGKIVLHPSICSVKKDVVEPIQKMLRNIDNTKVPILIASDDIIIYIDRLRLKQVMANLLSNALKFTTEGHIAVNLHRTAVDENGMEIEDSLVITVSDTGIGVSEENREILFSKWRQQRDNLNSANSTGIGLCVSNYLVLSMGGKMYLNEKYNSHIEGCPGAQFVIRFPMNSILAEDIEGHSLHSVPAYTALSTVVKATKVEISDTWKNEEAEEEGKTTVARHISKDSYISGSFRILIVDDDNLIRKLFKRRFMLMFPDAVIDEAPNGEGAIEYVSALSTENIFDVILIDHYMGGGMNGEQTIKKLRACGVDSLIVGVSGNDIGKEHIAAGADNFFLKPLGSQRVIICNLLKQLPPPRGQKVLIVDSVPVSANFLKRKLFDVATAHLFTQKMPEKHWYISICTDPQDAVCKLKREWFDLVVSDLDLNDASMSGLDLIAYARKYSLNRNAILVLNSGSELLYGPHMFNIYWSKPLPSVEKMRRSLCKELIRY